MAATQGAIQPTIGLELKGKYTREYMKHEMFTESSLPAFSSIFYNSPRLLIETWLPALLRRPCCMPPLNLRHL